VRQSGFDGESERMGAQWVDCSASFQLVGRGEQSERRDSHCLWRGVGSCLSIRTTQPTKAPWGLGSGTRVARLRCTWNGGGLLNQQDGATVLIGSNQEGEVSDELVGRSREGSATDLQGVC